MKEIIKNIEGTILEFEQTGRASKTALARCIIGGLSIAGFEITRRKTEFKKEIVVPKGYYDQDSKDFEQASLDDFVSLDTVKHLEQQITELERYPDDMKLEEFEFRRQYMWDDDLQRLGLSSRQFTNGSDFGDTIHRLQKAGEKIRWCVFSVDRNYYISKEENEHNNGWCEVWTKKMDKDLEEAKKYCEDDAFEQFKTK